MSGGGRASAADRMLPNFLGIGVPRAGTTWLHDLLSAHPRLRLPTGRKELNFFDLGYHRGLDWYARCFERPSAAAPEAVGEITPVYVYSSACRERIRSLGTVERFLVCIREPVDLLVSGYRQNAAVFDFRGSLVEFMQARPDVVANGLYARAARPWIEEFGLDRFLFLRFDEMVADVGRTKQTLGRFLGVDPELFPESAGLERVNPSVVPRFRRTYSWAQRSVAWLHRSDLSWLVGAGKRAGLARLLGRPAGEGGTVVSAGDRSRLRELYHDDLVEFAALTGQDLSSWTDEK